MLVHILSICLYIASDDENKDDQSFMDKNDDHVACCSLCVPKYI